MARKLKLLFRSVGKDDAPVYHINGAHGGPTPDGCVAMWTYVESAAIPDTQVGEADAKGGVTVEPPSSDMPTIDRRFQCGLVMTPGNAREIAKWLGEQADKADQVSETIQRNESLKRTDPKR